MADQLDEQPRCPICRRTDDMVRDSRTWVCFNPPCMYVRAVAKVQRLTAAAKPLVVIRRERA